MEEVERGRRVALRTAVAALCVETGYVAADKDAVETLTQILQSYIVELARTSRVYCEQAQRLEPTVADVQLALIDLGSQTSSLRQYSKRPLRRHVQRQIRILPQPQPKCLQIGSRPQRPSHIPAYLPSLPDSHTYLKTPTFASPVLDYFKVREKLATQQHQSKKSLSKLLGKTRDSVPVAGERDDQGLYTVVKPSSADLLLALMPSLEDRQVPDPALTTVQTAENDSETTNSGAVDSQETNDSEVGKDKSEQQLQDSLFENPFLKPARQLKFPTT